MNHGASKCSFPAAEQCDTCIAKGYPTATFVLNKNTLLKEQAL